MGWGEPSAYPAGSAHGRILTPNLDAFAASGIRFTDAYAGYTVCAPSRTTLMTGFHSGHFGAKKLPGTSLPTSVDVLTTPEMLQKAGYATAGIGKMAPLNAPVLQGFDYFIGQISQSYCHNMYPRAVDTGNTTGLNVNLTQNYKIPPDPTAARKLCMANPSEFNYTVDITHEHSMTWIKNEGGKMREGEKENHNRVECSHFPALFFFMFF
jgi:arylsulfatase A